jgi:hypothetical protein
MTKSQRAFRTLVLAGLTAVAFEKSVEGTAQGQCFTACSYIEKACKSAGRSVCGTCAWDYGSQFCYTPVCCN